MRGQRVGYIRVSSGDQRPDRQLEGVAVDKLFQDRLTGSVRERPGLAACLSYLREGDALHVHSIDRLARNLLHLQQVLEELTGRGISVVFHKENLSFSSETAEPLQRLLFQLLGAFAEFERTLIRERQREGIAAAKARGQHLGRPRRVSATLLQEIRDKLDAGITPAEVAKTYGLPRTTVYGYRKGLRSSCAEGEASGPVQPQA